MPRLLVLTILTFTLFGLITVACGVDEPSINRSDLPPAERQFSLERSVYIPIEDQDLGQLFEKIDAWVLENEHRIDSFSVSIVNATFNQTNSSILPSGALIIYTLKKSS